MSDKYVLKGTEPVPEPDLLTWARWFETADRHVARTVLDEDVEVSTVFLGVNYQRGKGPPLLFETMVFGGPLDSELDRCTTGDEAELMHQRMVVWVRDALAASTGDSSPR